ncbi:hypothetical protein Bbelb_342380 [Branchiostoma belcheri]|nr:hypothetical protein Bbelb_342380 [Branchiostoma belcheri]
MEGIALGNAVWKDRGKGVWKVYPLEARCGRVAEEVYERTFCGRVQDAVRDFPRESAGRPPGECDTFCGRVRYVQRESANIARRLPGERRGLACPTVFEDWTGSGCNIKGAGGFC